MPYDNMHYQTTTPGDTPVTATDGLPVREVTASVGFTSIGQGRKVVAVAGTAEVLAASTPCKYVVITAEENNTGVIVVGAAGVVAALATRQGTPLEAGGSVGIPISNLNLLYLDTTVNTDGVTYTYYN